MKLNKFPKREHLIENGFISSIYKTEQKALVSVFQRILNIRKLKPVLLLLLLTFFCFNSSISESEEFVPIKASAIVNDDNNSKDRIIIKAVESIILQSTNGPKIVKARIDTGATQSSIDLNLARELGYTKYIGKVNVVSANGVKTRLLVEVNYELSGKKIRSTFTLADRSNLNYSVLIGRTDLGGFLIDPTD